MVRSLRILIALLLLSSAAHADLYNRFGPVTGVLKGNASSPQTSAATSADIRGLFTGTCNATTFLRGDGACASGSTALGTGSANQVLATPNGSSGNISLRALVAADLVPINLGSTANGGVSSSSILLGTNGGTSNGFFSVTGPSSSLKTFTFPNASATVLTSNAPVTVPQGGTGVATLTNHGVLLGQGTGNLAAVAAMALDTVLQGQGASADPAAASLVNCGDTTHAVSYNTTTHAWGCQNLTPTVGTFTFTGTGFTSSPTGTASYIKIGNFAILFFPAISGTSNATTFTLTGLPSDLIPPTIGFQECVAAVTDNGAESFGQATFSAGSSTVSMEKAGLLSGWTPSGSKGFGLQTCVFYVN